MNNTYGEDDAAYSRTSELAVILIIQSAFSPSQKFQNRASFERERAEIFPLHYHERSRDRSSGIPVSWGNFCGAKFFRIWRKRIFFVTKFLYVTY